jgi:hypothetical protein
VFEKTNRVFHPSVGLSSIDVALYGTANGDNCVLYLESKFTEYLEQANMRHTVNKDGKEKYPISAKYKSAYGKFMKDHSLITANINIENKGKGIELIAKDNDKLPTIWAHAWKQGDEMGWAAMVPSVTESGIWFVDIREDYTDIMFERRDPSGNQYDGGADKHKTADLKLDIYGNEFKITEYGHNSGASKANGEWHWKWYEDTYELGVSTNVVEQNGDNLQIHCTALVYKTSCAPGFKHGFEYSTSSNMSNPIYVEYAQGYVEVGKSYEKYIDVEPGEYYVRAVVQYENSTKYHKKIEYKVKMCLQVVLN